MNHMNNKYRNQIRLAHTRIRTHECTSCTPKLQCKLLLCPQSHVCPCRSSFLFLQLSLHAELTFRFSNDVLHFARTHTPKPSTSGQRRTNRINFRLIKVFDVFLGIIAIIISKLEKAQQQQHAHASKGPIPYSMHFQFGARHTTENVAGVDALCAHMETVELIGQCLFIVPRSHRSAFDADIRARHSLCQCKYDTMHAH